MTIRECVPLVTGSYFWSRKKAGGHAIRSAVGNNPLPDAHFNALCVTDDEFIGEGIYTARAGERICSDTQVSVTCAHVVNLFRICDLDLDPMTFINELDLYCLEMYRMCKYELPTSRLSNIIV